MSCCRGFPWCCRRFLKCCCRRRGRSDVRSTTWYPAFRHTVFAALGDARLRGAEKITIVGVKPSPFAKWTCAEFPALMEDLRDAYLLEKAPFFNLGQEVIPFQSVEEKRVNITNLASELKSASLGASFALVVSCSELDFPIATSTIQSHNNAPGFNAVSQFWSTAQDVFAKGLPADQGEVPATSPASRSAVAHQRMPVGGEVPRAARQDSVRVLIGNGNCQIRDVSSLGLVYKKFALQEEEFGISTIHIRTLQEGMILGQPVNEISVMGADLAKTCDSLFILPIPSSRSDYLVQERKEKYEIATRGEFAEWNGLCHGDFVAVKRSNGINVFGRIVSNLSGKFAFEWDASDVQEWLKQTKLADVPSIKAAFDGRDGQVLLRAPSLVACAMSQADRYQFMAVWNKCFSEKDIDFLTSQVCLGRTAAAGSSDLAVGLLDDERPLSFMDPPQKQAFRFHAGSASDSARIATITG